MARTHLLVCQHVDCAHAARHLAGDLPERCPECKQEGYWLIARVYEWTVEDCKFLRTLGISLD